MYIPHEARGLPLPHETSSSSSPLSRRQFSDNGTENANIRTGIILGCVLGGFFVGLVAFCCLYRKSILLTYQRRRKRGHHGHHGARYHQRKKSTSSKSSKNSGPPPEGKPAE